MTLGRRSCRILTGLLLTGASTYLSAFTPEFKLSTAISASALSPSTVGNVITWSGTATGSSSGNLWYRFRVREVGVISDRCRPRGARIVPACVGANFSVLQDFGPGNNVAWTASDH